MHGFGSERPPHLNREGRKRNDAVENGLQSDLEHGNAVPAANVGFGRVLALEKPDTGKLILATVALLIASMSRDLSDDGDLFGYIAYNFVIGDWGPKAGYNIYHISDADLVFGGITIVSGILGTIAGGQVLDKITNTISNAFKTFVGTPFWMAPEVIQNSEGYKEKCTRPAAASIPGGASVGPGGSPRHIPSFVNVRPAADHIRIDWQPTPIKSSNSVHHISSLGRSARGNNSSAHVICNRLDSMLPSKM